ncbi:MAG: lipid-A-disaccharide synthase [Alphaproteobacteria bacterium]|nr:lipid-A-disaccharide synthase [Alphaproteobacteria bacterium]
MTDSSQVEQGPLTIMLVAGEPSGDALGGQIIEAFKSITDRPVRVVGVGGEHMRAAGLHSLFGLDDTSVMGLREVVPRIPRILRRVREAADLAVRVKPDIAVMIDSPDFTHRVARRIKRLAPDVRLVNYVAPQVWASRPKRAQKMAQYFDHVLCLLPFEVPFFEKHGLPATFVGHPVVERAPAPGVGVSFRAGHGISEAQKLLVLLPGSRVSEVRYLWDIFRQAVEMTEERTGPLAVVVPTVPTVARRVREAATKWRPSIHVIEDSKEKWAAFDASDVALAASGTVSTELALASKPMVVGYRVGALTARIARQLMTLPPHITLVNLILNRRAIPEFVQENCTPENLSRELVSLLTNPSTRMAQVVASGEAIKALGFGDEPPSVRAARAILELATAPREEKDSQN